MSASIRGDKGHLRILENGSIVNVFTITRFSAREDSQMHESYYLGQKDPETDKNQMGWSGSINTEVKNAELDLLIQRINDAHANGVAPPQVVLVLVEEFPPQPGNIGPSRASHIFTDTQLIYEDHSVAGVQEKVVKSLSFKARRKRVEEG